MKLACYNYTVINMKNRKKGFTLIELLLVIAILGVVSVIATISLTETLNDTKQKKCDEFVQEVEDAACVYSGLSNKEIVCTRTNCPPISLDILVKEGKITSETDACTGKDIDLSETVTVSWNEDGEKHCEYNGVKEYAK